MLPEWVEVPSGTVVFDTRAWLSPFLQAGQRR